MDREDFSLIPKTKGILMGQRSSLRSPYPLAVWFASFLRRQIRRDEKARRGRKRGERRECCRGNYQRRFFVYLIATLNYREKYREGNPAGKLKWLFLDLLFSHSFPLSLPPPRGSPSSSRLSCPLARARRRPLNLFK